MSLPLSELALLRYTWLEESREESDRSADRGRYSSATVLPRRRRCCSLTRWSSGPQFHPPKSSTMCRFS